MRFQSVTLPVTGQYSPPTSQLHYRSVRQQTYGQCDEGKARFPLVPSRDDCFFPTWKTRVRQGGWNSCWEEMGEAEDREEFGGAYFLDYTPHQRDGQVIWEKPVSSYTELHWVTVTYSHSQSVTLDTLLHMGSFCLLWTRIVITVMLHFIASN